jgi:hypothetical protein
MAYCCIIASFAVAEEAYKNFSRNQNGDGEQLS